MVGTAVAAFLPSLWTSSLLSVKIVDLLAIASLSCTAYSLMSMGPNDAVVANARKTRSNGAQGPMTRYIDFLNGGLSFLVSLNALSFRGRHGVHEGFWLLCVLPLS